MSVSPDNNSWPDVSDVVEAYEAAVERGEPAEVADFAPPPGHPGRLAILCELVRVDLEHRWERGSPRRLEDYRATFPTLFDDHDLVHAMAFEEFRLRLQAGDGPTSDDYRLRFGLTGRHWPQPSAARPPRLPAIPGPTDDGPAGMERAADAYRAYRHREPGDPGSLNLMLDSYRVPGEQAELLRSLDQADPHAAERLADGLARLPRVGADFLGFRLCGELGRGAFGRVFLARQGDLADRLVALKISADVTGESHALGRLQHTNVVPIYSVHGRGSLQAVCMPYLGATTLAHTLASLRGQATLPRTGEGLLSSLRSRKSALNAEGTTPAVPDQPSTTEAGAEPVDRAPAEPTPPQVEKLRRLGYVPAVLWIIGRAADGLAHAHERGILHRDLKPANILFADDGEPVLLDFNLAADTNARAGAAVALVGGTLPYMAPEHLDAFLKNETTADPRSDLYALGVIFFELLTGVHPFPTRKGSVDSILPRMIADRLGQVPDVRGGNPAVSPAVASVVRHCLEPDPARRYQSARELQEDLARQLENRPLKYAPEPSTRERLGKWVRRHPRLTSSTTVGLVALALVVGVASALAVRDHQYKKVMAAESLRRLDDQRSEAVALLTTPQADHSLVDEGLDLCRSATERYGVLDASNWLDRPLVSALPDADRVRLRNNLGDLLVLWAQGLTRRAAAGDGSSHADDLGAASTRLDRAEAAFGPSALPRALALARADLASLQKRDASEVDRLRRQAEAIPLRTDRERLLVQPDHLDPGLRRRLLTDTPSVSAADPKDFAVWAALGNWNVRLGRPREALSAYDVAIAMAPRLFWLRANRGVLFLETREFSQALEDFDVVVGERPGMPSALLNRALAKLGLGDARGAVDDLTRALESKDASTRTWFIRSQAKSRLGDREGARLDREEGLKRTPTDPAGFVARGLARLPADPQEAIADFDAALALDPRYSHALQDKASVLSENLGRPERAIEVLDKAVASHPTSAEAVAGRGVLLARLGRREAALRDAQTALALDQGAQNVYQAACVYALTSRQDAADSSEALRLLADAVRKDGVWLATTRQDHDLDPVRNRPGFQALMQSLEIVLRAGKTD